LRLQKSTLKDHMENFYSCYILESVAVAVGWDGVSSGGTIGVHGDGGGSGRAVGVHGVSSRGAIGIYLNRGIVGRSGWGLIRGSSRCLVRGSGVRGSSRCLIRGSSGCLIRGSSRCLIRGSGISRGRVRGSSRFFIVRCLIRRGSIRRFSCLIMLGCSVVGLLGVVRLRGAVGCSRGTIRVGNLFAFISRVQQQVSQDGSFKQGNFAEQKSVDECYSGERGNGEGSWQEKCLGFSHRGRGSAGHRDHTSH
jgi:hypothetical protein